jgi:chemotaxis protein methyltransferase CheR
MTNAECSAFLQRILPRLGLCWAGFRKVQRLVCKRISKRIAELGLPDLSAYRAYLEQHDAEWHRLEAMCCIPVSRFYRDRAVFLSLEQDVLPALAAQALKERRTQLRCWSACCAAGEEPYSLALLWRLRVGPHFPGLALRIVATDVDSRGLDRARAGCYAASSVKEVPESMLSAGFEHRGGEYCLRSAFRMVEFRQQNIRTSDPGGLFDLILCRNAVLTYFLPAEQQPVLQRVLERLRPGGALVIGLHESPPPSCTGVTSWAGTRAIYRAVPLAALESAAKCAPGQSHTT